MKLKLFFLIAALGYLTVSYGQQDSSWKAWNYLIGNWKGEGSGKPGSGGGTFSFTADLDNNIIIRKSHSEYPATDKKPKTIHDDLMIIYKHNTDFPSKANYFDNEGHVIYYQIEYNNSDIILTSTKTGNKPVFRLLYIKIDDETVNVKFEISPDGQKFAPYIEGVSKKVK